MFIFLHKITPGQTKKTAARGQKLKSKLYFCEIESNIIFMNLTVG